MSSGDGVHDRRIPFGKLWTHGTKHELEEFYSLHHLLLMRANNLVIGTILLRGRLLGRHDFVTAFVTPFHETTFLLIQSPN
jgi:hypothetical protein